MPVCCHGCLELQNESLFRKHYAHEHFFKCMEEHCLRSFPSLNSINHHRKKNEHSLNFNSNITPNCTPIQSSTVNDSVCGPSNYIPLDVNFVSLDNAIELEECFFKGKIPSRKPSHVINFIAKLYNFVSIPRSLIDQILQDIQELFKYELNDIVSTLKNKNVKIDSSIEVELEKK